MQLGESLSEGFDLNIKSKTKIFLISWKHIEINSSCPVAISVEDNGVSSLAK